MGFPPGRQAAERNLREHSRKEGALRLLREPRRREKSVSVALGDLPRDLQARAATPGSGPSGADVPKLGLRLAPAGQVARQQRRCIAANWSAAPHSARPIHAPLNQRIVQ